MSVTAEKQIDILLEEYRYLSTTILSLMRSRFVMTTVFVALLGALLAVWIKSNEHSYILLGIGVVVALVLVLVWWQLGYLLFRVHHRMGCLEKQINGLAGLELLGWEHRYSPGLEVPALFKCSPFAVVFRHFPSTRYNAEELLQEHQ